ncbi:MAG: transglutaminaseTgpA domain-containing protein [Solirubrobacteraceae bacterium]|nr:transglutaminaseTgpA domain-containing protein [Solirubrobacteraceae bacterium]
MTAHEAHVTKDGDARARVVAVVVLGLAAIGIWAPVLGSGVFWSLPMLILAAGIVARGALPQSAKLQLLTAATLPVWLVIAFLLAGLPTGVFSPGAIGETRMQLGEALLGLRDGGMGDPWVLAVWLATSGFAWLVGAMHALRHQRISAAIGFFMLCIPFATALLFQRAADAPWHGAVVLGAALLWTTKSELRGSLPAVGAVVFVAVVVSALIGPSEQKFSIEVLKRGGASGLDTRQTYGPDREGNSTAPAFEITSPKGSLWRMETLGYFDGRAWFPDPTLQDDLPQPAAVETTSTVKITGLRDDRVAAPGRVLSARDGTQAARLDNGYRAVFGDAPSGGSTYQVTSEEVRAPLDELSGVQIPKGAAFDRYRELAGARPPSGTPLTSYADQVSPNTPWGKVYRLAASMSDGVTSQLELVERVQRYLDSGEFRYSLTDVPEPGSEPLIDFLTTSKVGYCQHFAGAAALLLRLAGVPVRVVAGFATGKEVGGNTYEVRGTDAHAWIEVYFQGFGWVPFDPTVSDTAARVDPSVGIAKPETPQDEASGAAASAPDGPSPKTGIVLLVLVIVGGLAAAVWSRLRTPREEEPLSEILMKLAPVPAGPAMTISELRVDLEKLGPTVAALADRAERQRFADPRTPPPDRPRRAVLRALLKDLGPLRTGKLLVLGPGRRPVVDEESAALQAASVAPPPLVGASSAPPPRD